MASGICYTQSGSEKRYESTQWEGVKLKSSKVNISDYTLTGPDSDGNYSITSNGFGVTNVGVPSTIPDNSTYWVMTKYGNKPCYFEFLKNQVTKKYDIYSFVNINDCTDYQDADDPTYNFFNKISFTIGDEIDRKLDYLNGYKKVKTVSVTGTEDSFGTNNHIVPINVKVQCDYPGTESGGGILNIVFFCIPNGANPEDYINYPSIDGEFSNITYDNNFYKSEEGDGVDKEIIFNDSNNDISVTVTSRLNLIIDFKSDSEGSNNFESGWSSGKINLNVSAKNRYSTTIPILSVNFYINLKN